MQVPVPVLARVPESESVPVPERAPELLQAHRLSAREPDPQAALGRTGQGCTPRQRGGAESGAGS